MIAPADAGSVEGGRVLDHAERRLDPTRCPLGLPHRAGDAGCLGFRLAVVAKGLRPPEGGWACRTDPADATTGRSG